MGLAARLSNTSLHFAIFAHFAYKNGATILSNKLRMFDSGFRRYLEWQDIYEKGERWKKAEQETVRNCKLVPEQLYVNLTQSISSAQLLGNQSLMGNGVRSAVMVFHNRLTVYRWGLLFSTADAHSPTVMVQPGVPLGKSGCITSL